MGAVAPGTSGRVALDESAALPGALDRRACAAVCLKVARSGGITGLLRDAGKARRCGYQIYLASTLDGPLGVAAALHAAAALPGGPPERASGLATLAMFEQADPLAPSAGRLTASETAGLGDERLRAWYR
jgi:L-alanine-DL-glutamate epimerase-like enolase superfamily enzyme